MSSYTDTGPGGNKALSYDSRGNVTGLGGLSFVYDLSDQPVSVSGTGPGGAVSGTYLYDGNKRRVKSVVNGQVIYNVYDASGALVYIDDAENGDPLGA